MPFSDAPGMADAFDHLAWLSLCLAEPLYDGVSNVWGQGDEQPCCSEAEHLRWGAHELDDRMAAVVLPDNRDHCGQWLGEHGEFVPIDAARYPIFHIGPRLCLGKEMAYVQMKMVTAVVLRRFRVNMVASVASMEAPHGVRDDDNDEDERRAIGAAQEAGRIVLSHDRLVMLVVLP